MLRHYRSLKLSSRLIAFGLAEALVFAIVLRNYPLPTLLPAVFGAAGALLVLDSALRRASTVLAAIVALGQLLVGTYGALTTDSISATASGTGTGFTFLFLQAFVLLALSVSAAWAIYFARGRIWVNLLIASALLDFSFIVAVGFAALPLLWAAPAGLAVSFAYLTLRTVRFRRAARWRPPARSKATLASLRSSLEMLNLTVREGSGVIDFYATDKRVVLVVAAIEAKGVVKLNDTGLIVDDEDLTPLLGELAKASRSAARSAKLPRTRVYPVVLTRKSGLNPALRSVRVRSRQTPDRTLGTVYLANAKGLKRLLVGGRDAQDMATNKQARAAALGS